MKRIQLVMGMMLLMAGYTMNTNAQVVNDDNEDGVVKLNANQSKYDYVQGQVLVKFKDENRVQVNAARGMFRSSSVSRLTQVLKKYGTEEMEQLLPNEKPNRSLSRSTAYNGETIQEKDLSQLYRVKLSEEHAQEALQLVDELKTLDEVEFAEPNYLLHTLDEAIVDGIPVLNPLYNNQWYLASYGVTTLWAQTIKNPTRPIIAIIDTGVDMTHPDLAPNLWINPGEVDGEKGYDNDHNGFANDLHGWDFVNNTPNVRDFNMHGTHVAGIAAAANNNIGIVGANPRALIMPVSVMQSDGSGDVGTIIQGINYAVANGATVLNLSLGTYANSLALRQALEKAYQKAVIVAAAGNDGRCINSPHHPKPCYNAAPMFPAAYSFVLGVQATQQNGSLAAFSNYDDDGNTYSMVTTPQDPDGFNYELKAPGTNMLSTIPGGKYKVLQGTSMAAPLVAGAISFLKMVKIYNTQEILWGDLLHTNNIAEAYAVSNRPAELDLQKILFRDKEAATSETEEDYSNDGEIDHGETVYVYPVIRTTFGGASNIKMHLEMGDFEDPNTVEIVSDEYHKVDFGIHLDAYGKAVSLNPLVMRVADGVADGRHIKLKIVATCDESTEVFYKDFAIIVNNGIKIGGMIDQDMILYPNKHYIVNSSLAIPEGVTLTVMPGTTIKFKNNTGIASSGNLVLKGEVDNMINFENADLSSPYLQQFIFNTKVEYVRFYNLSMPFVGYGGASFFNGSFENCIFEKCRVINQNALFTYNSQLDRCVISGNDGHVCEVYSYPGYIVETNVINNNSELPYNPLNYPANPPQLFSSCNILNNTCENGGLLNVSYASGSPLLITTNNPSYWGSSKETTARQGIIDMYHPIGVGYAKVDLSNMLTAPVSEAHGIVWKVCVNGHDAQDEYDQIAPLGIGTHKFEVYFNRPMNKAVAPQISFGVRDPWTQNAVAEDGSWNEEGTIYTAYKTITGKTKSDGVNRIYVRGAEDDEYFEIPYEKTRFNVMINAAGSMATGFAAEAKMGRVDLTWDNTHNDFEDAMGFNVYRYNAEAGENTAVRLNQEIIDVDEEEYTDYEVTPGTTYCYYYKVLSTDLQEYDVSNVVAATPLTSQKGDADGSGDVKVGDVISTVNYILGENPKPFIYEAADMNTDQHVDVLDVIGIIQAILNQPSGSRAFIEGMAQAVYTVEDGVLYVETPVEIAGLQAQVSLTPSPIPEQSSPTRSLSPTGEGSLKATAEMKGFEVASTWLTENDYRMLAYSFGSKTLAPGKHAIMTIGDADLTSLRLADTAGNNVLAVPGDATLIKDAMGSKVMTTKGVWNLSGQKVMGNAQFTIQNSQLKKGVYIIDGQKVVK